MGLKPNDRVYSSLPLYHGSGSMVGVSLVFMYGTQVALRTKFSASNFWKDCIKYDCTVSKNQSKKHFFQKNRFLYDFFMLFRLPNT